MEAAAAAKGVCFLFRHPIPARSAAVSLPSFSYSHKHKHKHLVGLRSFRCSSTAPLSTTTYEFSDGSSEVDLRLNIGGFDVRSSRDLSVNADDTSLAIRVLRPGSPITLIETNRLFDRIKPAETIWYIDDDQLVVNFKKQDPDLKWPDIMESWESLAAGSTQLLKGASIYLVGDSTEINQKVAQELATGLGYTPLSTKELLESISNQTVDSWLLAEGSESVANAEGAVLESISSHVRTVVATLGGKHGAAGSADRWRHLYAGFTVWLSQTEAKGENFQSILGFFSWKKHLLLLLLQVFSGWGFGQGNDGEILSSSQRMGAKDEDSAKEETHKSVRDGSTAYTNADVVVKLQGWDAAYAKSVAQACLSALKQLILSDKKLPGKKSLYIRLGCRGDWPNIKPPGWDPSSEGEINLGTQ
ncbi:putative inactive shikimate kinase like 2, chloroplastic [Stylosanthes scabra]|uniref:Inactive shikimate kinase like 2, chloroplastic n=1 Tax=Stylosanthes scabra TaxID=79078 RepID=A0ABU6Y691_9FABA|nr:putative inactive shikimate kinase like 2, chloroplastic [Stylosanthes scabra]